MAEIAPDALTSEMHRQESRIMTPWGSLAIFGTGLLIQLSSYPLLLVFTLSLQELPLGQMIMFIVLLIWFFLPLLGVLGIIVGVKCYLRRMGTFLPLVGIIMNALWLAAFGLVFWAVCVAGITV